MIVRCRCGNMLMSDTLFRTATRSAASASVGGCVSSRSTTMSDTRRKRLTAALSTLSSSRRLLRSAFRMTKPVMLMAANGDSPLHEQKRTCKR